MPSSHLDLSYLIICSVFHRRQPFPTRPSLPLQHHSYSPWSSLTPIPHHSSSHFDRRMRTDARKEDKARGKRLFGNILGTLQKFQKEDKSSRTSEAAKRREQVSERIAAKLRSESALRNEIADSEKELKSLRISTESSEYVLRHKEVALQARHEALKPTSKFLYTSLPAPVPPIFDSHLLHPSPIPLVKGPGREPPHGKELPPLYYLPKILLPHQKDALHTREVNIAEIISEESTAIVKEREEVISTAEKNRKRIEELSKRLSELRQKVKGESGSGSGSRGDARDSGRDELGRTPREEMQVDRGQDQSTTEGGDVKQEQAGAEETNLEQEREDKEQGVLIKGDEGDIEVEY
ncbi:hypothetical protein I316_00165 [Kwoniella heveanensis BCC8398]|uniref:Pinin/SDK/MemA protein domain-containing protein n=1 Tax=Kwoniella heveanensis BCC8398 TaxID=1296120 RepID=A0A1B9H3T4_9TREE|nr:hypothetical protein I316_00165 [Kwoniella heveanensis BCC8398]